MERDPTAIVSGYASAGVAKGVMADSQFWRDMEARFRAIPDPTGDLRADWNYVIGSGGPGTWRLAAGLSPSVRVRFEALARLAGVAIDNPAISDPLIAWLHALRLASPDYRPDLYYVEMQDGTEGAHHLTGTVRRVCEASADQCCVLESRAMESAAAGRKGGTSNHGPPAESGPASTESHTMDSLLGSRDAAIDAVRQTFKAYGQGFQRSPNGWVPARAANPVRLAECLAPLILQCISDVREGVEDRELKILSQVEGAVRSQRLTPTDPWSPFELWDHLGFRDALLRRLHDEIRVQDAGTSNSTEGGQSPVKSPLTEAGVANHAQPATTCFPDPNVSILSLPLAGDDVAERQREGKRSSLRRRRGRPRTTKNCHPEVEEFLQAASRHRERQLRLMDFWLVAGFSDDTIFGAWRRGDEKRFQQPHARAFERVLKMPAEEFLSALAEVKSLV
jgi:hypothetical protein